MKDKDYPLLPSDRYLARMLEISDEEYAEFKAQARQRYREQPSPLVVNEPGVLALISLVLTVISVGLTIVASFFKPKPGRPAKLEANQKAEDAINSVERYAPRVGFDAAQDIARIGQTIPLVYAKRELINGAYVGGVRITCPLIWSQIQSYGGSQLLRAVFLISEGTITSIDANNFAIGSNAIGGYLLDGAADQSRLSIYFSGSGGRLSATHHIAGRPANTDPGAVDQADIFRHQSGAHFCSSSKPTTQTTFGVYAPIGNNLGIRVNPVVRPAVNANLVPEGDEGDAKVKCDRDNVSASMREKYKAFFSTRSGLISGSVSAIGDTCTYKLFRTSDANTEFSVELQGNSWGVSVSLPTDSFQPSYFWGYNGGSSSAPSTQTLEGLVSVSTPTVNIPNSTITTVATFNVIAGANVFKYVRPGTYTLNYKIRFTNGDVSIERSFSVGVSQSSGTSYNWEQTSATVTDPVYTTDGATITLTSGGSVSVFGNVQPTTTYTTTFSNTSDTIQAGFDEGQFHQEKAGDIASSVASRQRGWDDSIVVGELYRIGSALAICISRTDDVFQSEAEFTPVGGGKEITATFKAIRGGEAAFYTQQTLEASGLQSVARTTGTSGPQLFRTAIGNVTTARECNAVEIGIKSVLGTRVGGLLNFKDALTFGETDNKACYSKSGRRVSRGDTLKVDVYQSGSVSCSVERFSFFRIAVREAGKLDAQGNPVAFTDLGHCFGVRGLTQQNQFNAIRFAMPSKKRWEFRFEPVSGWEVRTGKAAGTLYVLESRLSTPISLTAAGATIQFNGIAVPRSRENFSIPVAERGDMGIPLPEAGVNNYIDGWGKLAESFIYEEVSTSTSAPEHEIVYINEIVNNAVAPAYGDLAILGLNIRSSLEWQQFSRFSCYVTGGIGNTHLFPEILKDILLNTRYGLGHAITAEQIDNDSFAAAATWCSQRGYYFDGVISERQNIRQWAADVAATMLLIFGEVNGKFFLRPALEFGSPEIKGLFTADNVLEKSYQMQYLDAEDRLPIQVSIKYREERGADSLTNPGLFPTERELLIREQGTAETEKVEQIDVSDYVTSRAHAIDIAKFIIRMRRLPTHGIKFQTTYDGLTANLAPGDYIRCAIDTSYYDDFNNGVVAANGQLTSTQSLSDGQYQVFAWDGSGDTGPDETTLTVSNSGTTASPTGIIFSVQNVISSIRTYQIESLGVEENGAITVEAVHMPTEEMTANWTSPTAWVIEE
jgi:hypothetical protein